MSGENITWLDGFSPADHPSIVEKTDKVVLEEASKSRKAKPASMGEESCEKKAADNKTKSKAKTYIEKKRAAADFDDGIIGFGDDVPEFMLIQTRL